MLPDSTSMQVRYRSAIAVQLAVFNHLLIPLESSVDVPTSCRKNCNGFRGQERCPGTLGTSPAQLIEVDPVGWTARGVFWVESSPGFYAACGSGWSLEYISSGVRLSRLW